MGCFAIKVPQQSEPPLGNALDKKVLPASTENSRVEQVTNYPVSELRNEAKNASNDLPALKSKPLPAEFPKEQVGREPIPAAVQQAPQRSALPDRQDELKLSALSWMYLDNEEPEEIPSWIYIGED